MIECKKCHIVKDETEFRKRTDRGDRRTTCLSCEKDLKHENYMANREKRLAAQLKGQQDNKEAYLTYQRIRRQIVAGNLPEGSWVKGQWEALAVAPRPRRIPDPEKIKQQLKEWAKNNPDSRAASKQKRRAAEGSFTAQEWRDLKAFYSHECLCCGQREPEIKLTADHVVPVSEGGTSYIDNIQPLCGKCNCIKATKTIDYRVGKQLWEEQRVA